MDTPHSGPAKKLTTLSPFPEYVSYIDIYTYNLNYTYLAIKLPISYINHRFIANNHFIPSFKQ